MSIAPIYSNFKNIDELKTSVMEKTLKIVMNYTEREYSYNTFLNVGLGLIHFAKENNVLYKTLFINSNEYSYLSDEFFSKNLEQMKKDISDDYIYKILKEVGEDITGYTVYKKQSKGL